MNGEAVDSLVLASGDVIEVGRDGAILRFRLYPPGSEPFKSLPGYPLGLRALLARAMGN